jgi:hypothetical protein
MRMGGPGLRSAFIAAGIVAGSAGAGAQEYCVACTGPDALYRCVLDNAGPGQTPSLQLFCLTSIARDGNHAQCAVKRGVTVFDCNGPVKRVSMAALEAAKATAQAQPGVQSPQPQAQVPGQAPAQQGEPKTLVEAMQRAKAASDRQWTKTGEQMKEAGQKTGDFFKKTFTCIGSLFTRCGGQE